VSREGLPTILGLTAFGFLMGIVGFQYKAFYLLALCGIVLLFALFSIYFFRDPKRVPPDRSNCVVSPADGKVIAVDVVQEKEFLDGEAKRIAIFLSLLDVHVNYVPFKGTVDYIRYNRGKFFRADRPEASVHNANILTGLETVYGKIAFKQSTGMIARRIVNYLKLDDEVGTGQKFGIIKFGSRMEVYLPPTAVLTTQVGDNVRAGESIIAEFHV